MEGCQARHAKNVQEVKMENGKRGNGYSAFIGTSLDSILKLGCVTCKTDSRNLTNDIKFMYL